MKPRGQFYFSIVYMIALSYVASCLRSSVKISSSMTANAVSDLQNSLVITGSKHTVLQTQLCDTLTPKES